jgi:hypothetical protein
VIRTLKLTRWTVSIVAFAACLIIGVLWVRSYWRVEFATIPRRGTQVFIIHSHEGLMTWYTRFHVRRGELLSWDLYSAPIGPPFNGEQPDLLRNLRLVRIVTGKSVKLPHWVVILACAAIGAAPWLRWRFNVRTVLVLMAIVAVLFAVIECEWKRL